MIRRIRRTTRNNDSRFHRFESRKLRRRFNESEESSGYTFDMYILDDLLDHIIDMSKQVVDDYGEEVAKNLWFTNGFGFTEDGSTSCESHIGRTSCLELSKMHSPKDFSFYKDVEKDWGTEIIRRADYLAELEQDGEDIYDVGELGLNMWFRFYNPVHPLDEMTCEYAVYTQYESSDDFYTVEDLVHTLGEDFLSIDDLEDSKLDEIAQSVEADVESRKLKESRVRRYMARTKK